MIGRFGIIFFIKIDEIANGSMICWLSALIKTWGLLGETEASLKSPGRVAAHPT